MPKKSNDPVIETIHAKHVFSQEELLGLSRELGRTCSEINSLESQKSAVGKDFAARIETQEIKRDGLIDNVTSGYAMVPTECVVIMDAKNRSKDYFKIGKDGIALDFVERREMTQADFQLALPETEEGAA
jgi:hypothetical protein